MKLLWRQLRLVVGPTEHKEYGVSWHPRENAFANATLSLRWARHYVLIFWMAALGGCSADALWRPVPTLVRTCVRADTLTLTVGGVSSPVAVRCDAWGWTRKVDTLPIGAVP